MPLAHRHTEEEMASKLLICMSKFDTFLRRKCHDIINGEPGQRGSCERGTAILEDDENGVPTATGEYNYALSLADVLAYFGKLWETRIESRDLPITSPTSDVSRNSKNEAHAAASGPRRTVSEHAFNATHAFRVKRPSGSAWRFEDERHHEHAHDDSDPFKLHDDVLYTHDGDPDAQRAALAHNSFLYDTYHDGAPKIDGSADFAQGDSHGDDEPPAQIDVDDEPGQIDVIAAFAQSGSDGVEPRQPAPEHAYRLLRPMPEGYDEDYFDFLVYRLAPDFAELEPVETHE